MLLVSKSALSFMEKTLGKMARTSGLIVDLALDKAVSTRIRLMSVGFNCQGP